jgi:hypothetical protein
MHSDTGRFLVAIWTDTVALACGTASFLLSALSAVFSTTLPPLISWPVAYVCLLVAAYRIWKKQDAQIAKLKKQINGVSSFFRHLPSFSADREVAKSG